MRSGSESTPANGEDERSWRERSSRPARTKRTALGPNRMMPSHCSRCGCRPNSRCHRAIFSKALARTGVGSRSNLPKTANEISRLRLSLKFTVGMVFLTELHDCSALSRLWTLSYSIIVEAASGLTVSPSSCDAANQRDAPHRAFRRVGLALDLGTRVGTETQDRVLPGNVRDAREGLRQTVRGRVVTDDLGAGTRRFVDRGLDVPAAAA